MRLHAAALVLAGGRSARFGSNKALALLRGEPLVTHALRAALVAFERVALVAKDVEPHAAHASREVALVPDRTAQQTPLAGLLAGIEWSPLEVCFSVAVDMPLAFDPALLAALFAALPGHEAAVPVFRGQPQPLCALWRRGPTLAAGGALLSLQKGPMALLKTLRTIEVAWDDERPFLDADTPEQLSRLDLLMG